MHTLVASTLALVSVFLYVDCESNASCSGGYPHGAIIPIDNYWYICQNGQRIPKGCLSGKTQIPIEGTFDVGNIRMQCVLGTDGYLTILYKSCVHNSQEYTVGARWNDDKTWYECKKSSAAVHPEAIGCVENGQTLLFDQSVNKDNVMYKCKRGSKGQSDLARAGCVGDGHKSYNIGETYESGDVWYTCTDKGGKGSGCVHNGQRMRDGDKYEDTSSAYICQAKEGEKPKWVPNGCIGREDGVDVEKKFDCYWNEGDGRYMYQMTCKYDEATNTAVKSQVQCLYKVPEGTFSVQPGCYYASIGISVGCTKGSDGKLQVRVFSGETVDSSLGLSKC